MNPNPVHVTDRLSNYNDQLCTAAECLGRSKIRQKIFKAIYTGKKQTKTIEEIANIVGCTQIHVLKEGGKLAGLLFIKVRNGYKKMNQFSTIYLKIIKLAQNPKKLDKIPTKTRPANSTNMAVTIRLPSNLVKVTQVTIDDIDSFKKVKKILYTGDNRIDLYENEFKKGLKNIIGEKNNFQDWGGESNDMFTTQLVFKGKRIPTAFALKGRGFKGILRPNRMGKRGDQVQRLFKAPAVLFLVQYNGQLDEEAFLSLMMSLAQAKSAVENMKIYYGLINGTDSKRLHIAYKNSFTS